MPAVLEHSSRCPLFNLESQKRKSEITPLTNSSICGIILWTELYTILSTDGDNDV